MILKTVDINKRFGGIVALRNVSVDVSKGDFIGVIGPNGSGKTTFINVISGIYKPDSGKIYYEDEDITNTPPYIRCKKGIARTYQIPQPFGSMSVLDNVIIASENCGDGDEMYAKEVLRDVGLGDKLYVEAERLSLVEKRLLELARALAAKPRLILIDEILAGLGESEIQRVSQVVIETNMKGAAVVWVEHRVHELIKFVKELLVFNFGNIIARGTPEDVLKNKIVIEAYLGKLG